MRPVDKGTPPKEYKNYNDARNDLAERIGYYCSYCEMKVYNSIEVEHILPQNKGGKPVDWNNLLLSCKYCNTIKSDHNNNISDYFWPDRDNTDLVFDYDEINVIYPKSLNNNRLTIIADATIKLMGLDRSPANKNQPTPSDTRWRSRKEAWDIANRSLEQWKEYSIKELAVLIANCALLSGHYSIWCKVFENETMVLNQIDNAYYTKKMFKKFDSNNNRIIRLNGLI